MRSSDYNEEFIKNVLKDLVPNHSLLLIGSERFSYCCDDERILNNKKRVT